MMTFFQSNGMAPVLHVQAYRLLVRMIHLSLFKLQGTMLKSSIPSRILAY